MDLVRILLSANSASKRISFALRILFEIGNAMFVDG
jgi:hypothetical protein